MKKSEMESHHSKYHGLIQVARQSTKRGLYQSAMECAESAWPYVDGMMRYEKRINQNEVERVEAIELVLKHAPLLLSLGVLARLDEFIDSNRRLRGASFEKLHEAVEVSRLEIWKNHQLWNLLESEPDVEQDMLRQKLGGDQVYWRGVVKSWEQMGLVARIKVAGGYQLQLATRMGGITPGECFKCGTIAEVPKAMLLEELRCNHCGRTGWFVIGSTLELE